MSDEYKFVGFPKWVNATPVRWELDEEDEEVLEVDKKDWANIIVWLQIQIKNKMEAIHGLESGSASIKKQK